MAAFPRPLKVGKIDNFTFSLSSGYLDSEVIISATVTTESTALTIDTVSNNTSVVSALCTGVTEGDAELHFAWTTATRSGCETHTVIILDC